MRARAYTYTYSISKLWFLKTSIIPIGLGSQEPEQKMNPYKSIEVKNLFGLRRESLIFGTHVPIPLGHDQFVDVLPPPPHRTQYSMRN